MNMLRRDPVSGDVIGSIVIPTTDSQLVPRVDDNYGPFPRGNEHWEHPELVSKERQPPPTVPSDFLIGMHMPQHMVPIYERASNGHDPSQDVSQLPEYQTGMPR